jgi:Zn-finger nucleic acid-binding protein
VKRWRIVVKKKGFGQSAVGRRMAVLWSPGEFSDEKECLVFCPACNEPMIVLEVEQIEIDHCIACGGVWLDSGELELLLESAANKDELMATLTECVEGKEKHIRCPICSKNLQKLRYGLDKEIILDKCPSNDGIWFDRGELCQALSMGEYLSGRPVYNVLSEIFGSSCTNGMSE